MSSSLVYGTAIVCFDVDQGTVLSHSHPGNLIFPVDQSVLASLCMPDGAHASEEEHTFLLFRNPVEKGDWLYGVSAYHSIKDTTVRRGAVQHAVLILTSAPLFSTMRAFAAKTVRALASSDMSEEQLLVHLHDSLTYAYLYMPISVNFLGSPLLFDVPVLAEDTFQGMDLLPLVQCFRMYTLRIWYSVLKGKRILIYGSSAGTAGARVLAVPLLVAPLKGLMVLLAPYICLDHLLPLERRGLIAGSSNPLFSQREEWFDVCANVDDGTVEMRDIPGLKYSRNDRAFMKNVLAGADEGQGEQWVREQFVAYTTAFLQNLSEGTLEGTQRTYLEDFKHTELWRAHMISAGEDKSAAVRSTSSGGVQHMRSEPEVVLEHVVATLECSQRSGNFLKKCSGSAGGRGGGCGPAYVPGGASSSGRPMLHPTTAPGALQARSSPGIPLHDDPKFVLELLEKKAPSLKRTTSVDELITKLPPFDGEISVELSDEDTGDGQRRPPPRAVKLTNTRSTVCAVS